MTSPLPPVLSKAVTSLGATCPGATTRPISSLNGAAEHNKAAAIHGSVVFRLEQASDRNAIDAIHESAFGPGRFARTAFRLRGDAPSDPALSFVALVSEKVVATLRLTPIQIGHKAALLLGPLAVLPDFANNGFGRALVKQALTTATTQRHKAILLVGDHAYYGPLGFLRVTPGQIVLPGPVDPLRILLAPLNGAAVTDFSGPARPISTSSNSAE